MGSCPDPLGISEEYAIARILPAFPPIHPASVLIPSGPIPPESLTVTNPLGPEQDPAPIRFFGGTFGAFLPFALFLSGVVILGLSGAPAETGLWPILLGALILGLLLSKDRHAYSEGIILGMSRPIVMTMVMAWILAGVLGTLLAESGLVQSLVWLARTVGVSGGGYVVSAFLIGAVVSTATGTSLGTILVCTPLLYPPGGALGSDPMVLMGAIIGGATFGDNVSPVSDTTIASATTQGADMGGVVRSRMRYALPAAGVALLVFWMFGAGAEGAGAGGVSLEDTGGVSGLLGGLASSLGGGKLADLASLAGGFKDLNLDSDMITKFIPVVMSFFQEQGGDTIKNLLAKVLK